MKKVSIIGLGYVGLPLAMNFAQKIPTIGYEQKKLNLQIAFQMSLTQKL